MTQTETKLVSYATRVSGESSTLVIAWTIDVDQINNPTKVPASPTIIKVVAKKS